MVIYHVCFNNAHGVVHFRQSLVYFLLELVDKKNRMGKLFTMGLKILRILRGVFVVICFVQVGVLVNYEIVLFVEVCA
jgi:hypothetical protein